MIQEHLRLHLSIIRQAPCASTTKLAIRSKQKQPEEFLLLLTIVQITYQRDSPVTNKKNSACRKEKQLVLLKFEIVGFVSDSVDNMASCCAPSRTSGVL